MSEAQFHVTEGKNLPDERVMRRIFALLNTAQGSAHAQASVEQRHASEQEAAVAASKVNEILLQYGLELVDLEAHDPSKKSKKITTHVRFDTKAPKSTPFAWCVMLGAGVADACFCNMIYWEKTRRMVFIGTATDATAAVTLYEWLSEQAEYLCYTTCFSIPSIQGLNVHQLKQVSINGRMVSVPKSYRIGDHRPHINARKWYGAFLLGIAQRLADRLRQEKQRAVTRADYQARGALQAGAATALVYSKQVDNDLYMQQKFDVKEVEPKEVKVDHSAYVEGLRAGDKVDMNPQKRLQ